MQASRRNLNSRVRPRRVPAALAMAVAVALSFGAPAAAREADADALSDLFAALHDAEEPQAAQIAGKIVEEWSKSGSPSFDLLLERGRQALAEGDPDLAIGHLTALTEQAPDFAEGWNARATAFFQVGEYGLAIEDIRQVLARNPRHFGALTGLAVILEEIGDETGALAAWREVRRLYPASPQADQAVPGLERRAEGLDT